jgi:Hypothetical protein (DUF2513)
MKVDQDYLKSILLAFQGSDKPTFYVRDFLDHGIDHQESRFVFHIAILNDQAFVVRDDRKGGVGLLRGADGSVSWSMVPLRLTAEGHEFIEAIENKEIWQTLKDNFNDASAGTLWGVGKKLLEAYAEKKVEDIVGKKF